MQETDLYAPVKAHLQACGYEVKAEIGPADVVAVKDDGPPLIVELKIGFSLTLLHQAIARQSLTDDVYIAVPRGRGRASLKALKRMKPLCRRLGLGLMTVTISTGRVEVHADPAPYTPRRNKVARARLLQEFRARRGDPNRGGAAGQRVTAYRQDAHEIAQYLAGRDCAKGSEVAQATGIARATRMMADNHYGWFTRIARGVYGLSEAGRTAVSDQNTLAA